MHQCSSINALNVLGMVLNIVGIVMVVSIENKYIKQDIVGESVNGF